jgi:ADP-ribose pyrophosphatase
MIKTLKKRLVYENKWIRLWEDKVEFPNGTQGIHAYSERVDSGPMIIPITEDKKVIVLREWRYPIQDWTYCFPFGGSEKGENPLATAKRELE